MVPTKALKLVTRQTLNDFKVVRGVKNILKKMEHYIPTTMTGNVASRAISASALAGMKVGGCYRT